jgi:hypothetical protein
VLHEIGLIFQSKPHTYMCVERALGQSLHDWDPGFSLLQENEGATLIVTAQFSVASSRSIVLQFQEVCLISLIPIFIHIFLSSHKAAV